MRPHVFDSPTRVFLEYPELDILNYSLIYVYIIVCCEIKINMHIRQSFGKRYPFLQTTFGKLGVAKNYRGIQRRKFAIAQFIYRDCICISSTENLCYINILNTVRFISTSS